MLFDAARLREDDNAMEREAHIFYYTWTNAIEDLLYASVSHKQPTTVSYLLEAYHGACILNDRLLGSDYANPDLPTLRVPYGYDPSIVHHRMEHIQGLYALLMDYCLSGNPTLLSFLLENGADPYENGYPLPTEPPEIANYAGQPPSLILAMIRARIKIRSWHVELAIRQQRTDILEIPLDHCQWEIELFSTRKDLERVTRTAQEVGGDRSIAIVDSCIEHKNRKGNWWRFLS